MATSQNGWTVIESGTDPRLVAIPKIVGRVRAGDVATIFTYLNERFDAEVEDIDAGRDDWGWAYRAIRGQSSGYSNHASGTAEDLNATRHPLGKRGTFTAAQVTALRRILAALGGVVRWGGDYTGRPDEMHFEIVGTAAQVATVAARIRAGQLVSNPIAGGGNTPTAPTLNAPRPLEEDDMPYTLDEIATAVVDKLIDRRIVVGDEGLDATAPLGALIGDIAVHARRGANATAEATAAAVWNTPARAGDAGLPDVAPAIQLLADAAVHARKAAQTKEN